MKFLDESPQRMQAVAQAMGPREFAAFDESSADYIVSVDSTLLQTNAAMSYPPQSHIDADPAFWKPKPSTKPALAAPAEKKPVQ